MEFFFQVCCALMDHPAPHVPLEGNVLPVVQVEAAFPQMGFDVVFEPLLLPSLGTLSLLQLSIQHLFWEAAIMHAYDMAFPSQLMSGDGCSNTRDIGLLQNTEVGLPVFPTDPKNIGPSGVCCKKSSCLLNRTM